MWGPGASQGGILQSSTCKFDLKEPYYRMSQPSYPVAQEPPLQPQQHLNTQVKLDSATRIGMIAFFFICVPIYNMRFTVSRTYSYRTMN